MRPRLDRLGQRQNLQGLGRFAGAVVGTKITTSASGSSDGERFSQSTCAGTGMTGLPVAGSST